METPTMPDALNEEMKKLTIQSSEGSEKQEEKVENEQIQTPSVEGKEEGGEMEVASEGQLAENLEKQEVSGEKNIEGREGKLHEASREVVQSFEQMMNEQGVKLEFYG